jgi:hypothetical protein
MGFLGENVRPDTQQGLHYGVNFLFVPPPDLSPGRGLEFQRRLAEPEVDIVFDRVQKGANSTVFGRTAPPLQVTIGTAGPELGQLLVGSPRPSKDPDDYIIEAEFIVRAFRDTWAGPIQVI